MYSFFISRILDSFVFTLRCDAKKKKRRKEKKIILYPNSSFCDVHAAIACCIPIAECCNATNKIVPAAMQSNATICSRTECQVQWHSHLTHTTTSNAFGVRRLSIYNTGAVRRQTFIFWAFSELSCIHTTYKYIDANV